MGGDASMAVGPPLQQCLLCVLVWRGLARIHPGDPSRDGELAFSFSYSHTLLVKDVEEVSGKAGYVVWEAGEGPQIKLPTWA